MIIEAIRATFILIFIVSIIFYSGIIITLIKEKGDKKMSRLPWGHRPDIIEIIESTIPNEQKANLIYDKIKDYEARANDGFTKPMPCTVKDIIEYLESRK